MLSSRERWRLYEAARAAIPESDETFGQVVFDAQSLATIVRASMELIEDGNLAVQLEDVMAKVFAIELDRAALMGSGVAPEPRGVFNTTGVTKTPLATNGAALTNYAAVVAANARLAAKNYTPGPLLAAPRSVAALAGLTDSTGQPLVPPPYLDGSPILGTGQVPTNQVQGTSGAVASSIFAAQWNQLAIGLRTTFRVLVLKERYADVGQIGFLGWLRADVQVLRADAFEVVTGVL